MEHVFEEMKVFGRDLVDQVKKLLNEANVRRVIIKDDKGNTFMEIPLTVATVGVIAMPLLAGLGAIAALVAKFTVVVERAAAAGASESGAGKPPETAA